MKKLLVIAVWFVLLSAANATIIFRDGFEQKPWLVGDTWNGEIKLVNNDGIPRSGKKCVELSATGDGNGSYGRCRQIINRKDLWGKSYKYNQDLSVAGKALTDGKWHHLAFVIDSAQSGADRAKLYLDRAPQSVPSANISDLAVDFFNATLYIGSRGNSEYKFTGEMDDVRISGAALTTDQFLQVRSSPQGTLLSLR